MKLTTIALSTSVALALAGPACAAGNFQQDGARSSQDSMSTQERTRSPQGMQDRGTDLQSRSNDARTGSMNTGPSLQSDRQGGGYNSGTVREVQQALQQKGIEVGPVDGIFGPKTQSAIREFQQQQGFTATGRMDRQTLAALNIEASGSAASGDRPGMNSR